MVRITIKSLEQVIKEKQDNIEELQRKLILKESGITNLLRIAEIKTKTIELLEEANSLLKETSRVQQEHIEIKKEQKDKLKEQLLSLSIGQRLLSWKKK